MTTKIGTEKNHAFVWAPSLSGFDGIEDEKAFLMYAQQRGYKTDNKTYTINCSAATVRKLALDFEKKVMNCSL